MFEKIIDKVKTEKSYNLGVFTESTLKTSFYEELQKNGWCDIVDDKPDDLTEIIKIKIMKNKKII